MNTNYDTMNDMEEIEIDLVAFMWRLAEQWKLMLLGAILVGVLIAAGKYARDVRDWNAALEGESKELSPKEISELEESLTEEELFAVEEAVRLKLDDGVVSDYIEKSPLMNIDPYHEKVVTLLYKIEKDEDIKSIVGQRLKEELLCDERLAHIAKSIHYKEDPAYLREIIGAGFGGNEVWVEMGDTLSSNGNSSTAVSGMNTSPNTVFKIIGKVSGTMDEKRFVRAIEEEMDAIIKDCGQDNAVTLFYQKMDEMVDTGLKDSQTTVFTNRRNNQTVLAGLEGAFTDDQTKLFEARTADRKGGAEGEKAANTAKKQDVEEPSFSMKYLCLGVVMGLFLYAGVVFVYILFSKKLCEENMSGMLYGENVVRIRQNLSSPSEGGMLDWFLHDPLVRKLRYRNDLPMKEQLSNARAQIRMLAAEASGQAGSEDGHKMILLSTGELLDSHQSLSGEIAASLKNDGIIWEQSVVDTSDMADAFEKTTTGAQLYLAYENDRTSISRTRELKKLLREAGVKASGVVVFG